MADNKRKQGPGGCDGGSAPKRSKGGSGGRWKTPHYQAKMSDKVDMGKAFEVGDQGFWVTFARGMKSKATREIIDLCEEYGESMYGLQKQSETTQDQAEEEDDEPADIEAAIQKELSNMKSTKPKTRKAFSVVSTNLECLLFVKTMNPVEPVEFVRNICQDARDCTDIMSRKTKYINRLTPVSNMDKSTEKGIDRVARTAMEPYFELVKAEGTDESAEAEKAPKKDEETGPKYAYAIRQNIRNNSTLKSDVVIKQVASLVQSEHKVNLTSPDKVVLIEIYQMFCGVSVVDGSEWESLKRYNMNELYRLGSETGNAESKTKGNTTSA